MSAKMLVEYVSIAECVLCLAVFCLIWYRKQVADYPMLAVFLIVRALGGALTLLPLFFRRELGLSKPVAYNIYFYSYWPSAVFEAIVMVLLVYGIYKMALAPFEPLQRLGTIIFRWVAFVSVAVALGAGVGPHIFGESHSANIVGQMQQTSSILTLCLLLFVCVALRPLGLTFASRPFGSSLGLGILAFTQLFQSSWLPTAAAGNLYSIMYFYSGLGACTALLVWATYFALPDAGRGMVLLPTTSPYFTWNKVSEALGDNPGFVAISGFTPDCMAPGELEAMMAACEPRELAPPQVMQPVAVAR